MFNCKTIEEARNRRDARIEDYKDVAEKAMECLDEGFEDAMTVMVLPRFLHKYYRISNQIERLNKGLKRRSNVTHVFPNEEFLIRLMGAVLLERHEVLSSARSIFNSKTYQNLFSPELSAKLKKIVDEQSRLLVA